MSRLLNRIKRKLQSQFGDKGILHGCIYLLCSLFSVIFCPLYKKYLLCFRKIDDKLIVFSSTPGYADNSKALYRYLRSQYPDEGYRYVWLMSQQDMDAEIPESDVLKVSAASEWHMGAPFKSLKKISEARYIFFTHGSPNKKIQKRPGQTVVNLWHGCGYKDIQQSSTSFISQNPFDYAIVPGNLFIDTKERFWGCRREQILPLGYPRYDLLKSEDAAAEEYAKAISHGCRLIVWMPTFRKTDRDKYPEEKVDFGFDIPLLSSKDDIVRLNDICRERNVVICIKRHPFQVRYSCENMQLSNIVFISNDDLVANGVDLYSFLHYTDALISDYSSISIDYLLLNKPIAYSLDDYEKYKAARGFVFEDPLEYMPGHHLYSFDDMLEFIDDVSNGVDRYADARAAIMSEVHNPCDNYCERIWNTVKNL